MRRSSPEAAVESSPQEADPLEQALSLAYRYLDRRDRSTQEVRSHLEAKGLGAEPIAEAIGSLEGQGLLDDARFARLFSEDKRMLEQWGSERIRSALLARGIDRNTIDAALDGRSPQAELEQALGLLRRRFTEPPRARRERDRALGVLLRKGYDPDLALDALAAYAGLAE